MRLTQDFTYTPVDRRTIKGFFKWPGLLLLRAAARCHYFENGFPATGDLVCSAVRREGIINGCVVCISQKKVGSLGTRVEDTLDAVRLRIRGQKWSWNWSKSRTTARWRPQNFRCNNVYMIMHAEGEELIRIRSWPIALHFTGSDCLYIFHQNFWCWLPRSEPVASGTGEIRRL